MAIIGNISTEIGDEMLFNADTITTKIVAINGFIDDVENENPPFNFWDKYFRYTLDGFNFTEEWTPLTDLNLQAIPIEPEDHFDIKYRYVHEGDGPAANLVFNNVQLNVEVEDTECSEVFKESLFGLIFSCCCDPLVLEWCSNVSEKMYKRGIVSNYLERGENNNQNGEDNDYIDFWNAICCFFSLFVNYSRYLENYGLIDPLLAEFLEQRGLFFCPDAEVDELIYLANNFYDEIRKRGTIKIIQEKDDDNFVDGELLRLICYNPFCDEFLFALLKPEVIGNNIDDNSPLYQGAAKQINKSYEDTEDFVDLSLYPLINPGFISIVTDGSRDVMSIDTVPAGQISGIGEFEEDKTIVVDPSIDYEIIFQVRQPITNPNFTFGCLAYNQANVQVFLRNIIDNTNDNTFFEEEELNLPTEYYEVRGIIYNYNAPLLAPGDALLDIGFGNHLKFPNEDICRIIPYIVLDNTNGGGDSTPLYIWDLKIRPVSTPYSLGFIQTNNFIQEWMKNNNAQYTEEDIDNIKKRYLYPYNAISKTIYLPQI